MSFRARAIASGLNALGSIYAIRLRKYPKLVALFEEMRSNKDHAVASNADALSLFEAVLSRKPQNILELGAGHSSAVIALAGEEAGNRPRFVAVEESPHWMEQHKKVIPSRLQERIELTLSGTEARLYDGTKAARYTAIPSAPYEFVHIDGPDHFALNTPLCGDVVDLLPNLAQRCLIVFDGREASARFARPYLEKAGFKTSRHPFTLSYHFVR
jgi:hypothetical protein